MALFPPYPDIALRRAWRLVALGAVALAIAGIVACGSSSQPDPAQPSANVSPAQQPGGDSQDSSQSVVDQQATSESSQAVTGAITGAEPATQAQPITAQAVGDTPVSQEATPDQGKEISPPGQQPAANLAGQDAVQPAAPDSSPALAVVSQPTPTTLPSESQASQAPPVGSSPANPADAPAVQPPPPATAAPAATQSPPATAPAPTEPPAPVVQEPLPDVGHQVGNRIPDITLELFGGSTISTADLVEQSKPTFLFFTATT